MPIRAKLPARLHLDICDAYRDRGPDETTADTCERLSLIFEVSGTTIRKHTCHLTAVGQRIIDLSERFSVETIALAEGCKEKDVHGVLRADARELDACRELSWEWAPRRRTKTRAPRAKVKAEEVHDFPAGSLARELAKNPPQAKGISPTVLRGPDSLLDCLRPIGQGELAREQNLRGNWAEQERKREDREDRARAQEDRRSRRTKTKRPEE